MRAPNQFFAWHPVLTDHQAFTYQALAEKAAAPVTVYVMKMEDETRRAQGWRDTQVTSIKRHLIPTTKTLRYCYQQLLDHRHDVHFFGSAFERPAMMMCLLMAAWLGIEFYLISEPYSPKSFGYFNDQRKMLGRIKSTLRPVLYWLYVHILRRQLSGIFAISKLAIEQYRQAGMPRGKLFPFGYFVPQTARPQLDKKLTGLRIVFVGALIQRKGLKVLIEAVQQIQGTGADVKLDIFGPGDPNDFDIAEPGIRYCGLIPFGESQEKIADYDLMVLPSHYDGWGVVVNEALCAGVPTVCSDQVGASILLTTFNAGVTFACGQSQDLAKVLLEIHADRLHSQSMQRGCIAAARAIQPAVAAAYILDVVTADAAHKAHVAAPWYPAES